MAQTPKRYNELRGGDNYSLTVKASSVIDEEYTLKFVGSSETPDRHGDIVKSDGWKLDADKANPVFLWGHDHRQLPVGKAVDVRINQKEKRLEFSIKFAVEEYAFAATVYKLFKSGFLNATSVGFMVLDYDYDEEQDAFILKENELLELSAVTVPANPDALIINSAKGLFNERDVERLKQEGMLKSVVKEIEKLLQVEKEEAEQVTEKERLEAEKVEQEKIKAEKEEKERLEAEKAEKEKLEAEQKAKEEAEQKAKEEEAEQKAKEAEEKLAAEKAEAEKLAAEQEEVDLAKDVKKLISKVEVLTDLVKKIITTKESNDSEEDKNLSGDNDDDNDDSDKEPSEKDMWSKISELLGLTEEAK